MDGSRAELTERPRWCAHFLISALYSLTCVLSLKAERIAIETGKRVLLIKGVTLDDMDEFHPVSGGWKQLLGMTTHRCDFRWLQEHC